MMEDTIVALEAMYSLLWNCKYIVVSRCTNVAYLNDNLSGTKYGCLESLLCRVNCWLLKEDEVG